MASYSFNSKPVSGETFSSEFMNGLDHRLVSRDAYESLVNKNYVKGDVSSKVSATRQQLKRELLQDKITDFLHSRPDPKELLHQHILEEGYNSGVAPAIMRAQKEYEAARKKNAVARGLARRSSYEHLVQSNILPNTTVAASRRSSMKALKRSMLEDKLKKSFNPKRRPSREDLVHRGIIESDVYDKVLYLDGDEAREILLRLTLRGDLWADQIKTELFDILDIPGDVTAKLEGKLSRRPSAVSLRNNNILKMRGSEVNTKFLATRALSKTYNSRPSKDELERVNIYREDEPAVTRRRTSIILDDLLAGRMDIEELRSRGVVNY